MKVGHMILGISMHIPEF